MKHPLDQGTFINKVEGPNFRDPKQEIRQRTDMNNALDRILMGKDPQKRREDAIEQMVNNFKVFADKDNVMSVDEFEHFEPLFNQEMRLRLKNYDLSTEELDMISDLSVELAERINLQKPTHIVDEQGHEVCPPLPPIMAKLTFMNGDMGEIVDTFHTVHVNDDGQAGGLNDARKKKATFMLLHHFRKAQNDDDLNEQSKEFMKTAVAFERFTGNRVDPRAQQAAPTVSPTQAPTNTEPTDATDDLEYAPVEDDD